MSTRSIEKKVSVKTVPGIKPAQVRLNIVKPGAGELLEACRKALMARISAQFGPAFDAVEIEFLALSEKTTAADIRDFWLKAGIEMRENRSTFEATFQKNFTAQFGNIIAGDAGRTDATAINGQSQALALVEDHELERNLAIGDVAGLISEAIGTELPMISERTGYLLCEPTIRDDANPFSPRIIANSLVTACDQLKVREPVKLHLLRSIALNFSAHLRAAYCEMNRHLILHGVLPDIASSPPAYRKTVANPGREPQQANPASPATNKTPANGGNANTMADIIATLRQLLAGGQVFDAALSAGNAAPAAHGVTTGSFAPAPPTIPRDSNLGPLTAEMRRIAERKPLATDAGLVAMLSQMQLRLDSMGSGQSTLTAHADNHSEEVPPTNLNLLHAIKTPDMLARAAPIDIMTIDIVAMLFDYIFDDDAIPDAIKGLIARLQIPALKVALLDRSFFSMKMHPARRLLDALANAAICFAGTAHREDPLYRMIATVVNRVHAEFETDIQIFAESLAEFEKFMAERELVNAEFIEQSARIVSERESREMARLIALDETDKRSANVELPAPVVALLKGPWARVLERIYLREGGRLGGFAQALETIDNLIWSVTPKANADERKRLVLMLPGLLKGLQYGMAIAAIDPDDRKRFFATLIDCHAAAVKAGLGGERVVSSMARTPASSGATPLFEKLIAEENQRETLRKNAARTGIVRIQFSDHGVEIEEIDGRGQRTYPAEANRTDAAKLPHLRVTRSDNINATTNTAKSLPKLKRGVWVEFTQNDNKFTRAKLAWISPLKGMYLFTSPGASEALSVAPEALQDQLRRGAARVIDESSMMDRAVDKLVNSLSHEART